MSKFIENNQTSIADMLNPKQTAEYFQISSMTLHRWSKQPGFPKPIKRGQYIRYDTAAIEKWLRDGS